jgi:nucleoside triphosphate pyrophosphatase
MQLILASQSRDRKKCFEAANLKFRVIPSNFDENSIEMGEPREFVVALALGKARTVVKKWIDEKASTEGPAIIVAADTMVLHNNNLLGKAKDRQNAIEILGNLVGQTHELLTGVAIINSETLKEITFVDSSKVHFQDLNLSEIHDYVDITDEYIGRAGSYSLQERASLFIDHIEGSPTNVLGIPMAKLRVKMKEFGANLLNFR